MSILWSNAISHEVIKEKPRAITPFEESLLYGKVKMATFFNELAKTIYYFDPNGFMIKEEFISPAGNNLFIFKYDSHGNLIQKKNELNANSNETFENEYDLNSNIISSSFFNSLEMFSRIISEYDAKNRILKQTTYYHNDEKIRESYEQTYNDLGQITQSIEYYSHYDIENDNYETGNSVSIFIYDAKGNQIEKQSTDGDSGNKLATKWIYDGDGNLIEEYNEVGNGGVLTTLWRYGKNWVEREGSASYNNGHIIVRFEKFDKHGNWRKKVMRFPTINSELIYERVIDYYK